MAKDYKLQERLGFRLSRLSKMMQTRLEFSLREHGVTRLEWCILSGVALEGYDSPSELADHIGITRPAVSRLLKGLTERRLIERALINSDGRSRKLTVTKQGMDSVTKCLPLVESTQDHFTKKLTAAQQSALSETLDLMLSGEDTSFEDL
ncbi:MULTISPECIES: MarR family winged helix-turn-helix transcriptional regulator [unclassified Ruegeria]|uniref:MarR family winged helix-turn-helix transcriptional regulator n=1 Tax=unclassified Ruegeria TaxID=2625375 RepID=UPI00148900A1|nr:MULTISPECIES: helix-turn-helix domain-containing protein [unclassified Ruegeria]